MAERALNQAARSLGQDSSEPVAVKLSRVWGALVATSAERQKEVQTDGSVRGQLHAAEEFTLRWLLKSMAAGPGTAAAAEAETLRRWPLTWHILGCLFARIPIFPLARALVDRRFAGLLRQTAHDLASPKGSGTSRRDGAGADVDRHRHKRAKTLQQEDGAAAAVALDLASLRQPQQCVASAGALFEALRALLIYVGHFHERVFSDQPTAFHNRMGAEHIKSIFYTSAADAMALVVPLLRVCSLALAWGGESDSDRETGEDEDELDEEEEEERNDGDNGDGRTAWLDTLNVLWEFHQRGSTDAFEVATHLAPFALPMLGRLLLAQKGSHLLRYSGVQPLSSSVALRRSVQTRWLADLRRFLVKNLMLPGRAALMNYNNAQTIVAAVGEVDENLLTKPSSSAPVSAAVALRCLVLYDMAIWASHLVVGSVDIKRDNERWLQAVLDAILTSLRAATTTTKSKHATAAAIMSAADRNRILSDLIDMAADAAAVSASNAWAIPSPSVLQLICKEYALGSSSSSSSNNNTKNTAAATAKIKSSKTEIVASVTETDWRLIAAVARCDADAFLGSQAGETLLDDILKMVASSAPSLSTTADRGHVASFLISLARGYAAARNLSGFIALWHAGICQSGSGAWQEESAKPPSLASAWLSRDLRAVVAEALPVALTREQLVALLGQLEGQVERQDGEEDGQAAAKPTAASESAVVAKLVVYDALSAGIRLEEWEDTVQDRLLEGCMKAGCFGRGGDVESLPPSILAIRWRLVQRTLAWIDSASTESIWKAVAPALQQKAASLLGRVGGDVSPYPLQDEDVFEAFICSFSLYLALQSATTTEASAGALDIVRAFVAWLQQELASHQDGGDGDSGLLAELQPRLAAYSREAATSSPCAFEADAWFGSRTAALATYLAWMLRGSSRFVDEMVKSHNASTSFLDALLSWHQAGSSAAELVVQEMPLTDAVSEHLLANPSSAQTETITSTVIGHYIERIESAVRRQNPEANEVGPLRLPHGALVGLLKTPVRRLPRAARERLLSVLLPPKGATAAPYAAAPASSDAVLVLDLLLHLLQEPVSAAAATSVLIFERILGLGRWIDCATASLAVRPALGLLDRFRGVAAAALKHSLAADAADAATVASNNNNDSSSSSSSSSKKKKQHSGWNVGEVLAFLFGDNAGKKKHKENKAKNTADAAKELGTSTKVILLQVLLLVDAGVFAPVEVEQLQDRLARLVLLELLADCDAHGADGQPSTPLLVAFDAAMAVDLQHPLMAQCTDTQRRRLVAKVRAAAEYHQRQGNTRTAHTAHTAHTASSATAAKLSWRWRAFAAQYLHHETDRLPREVRFPGLFLSDSRSQKDDEAALAACTSASLLLDSVCMGDYLANETRSYDQAALLCYMEDVLVAMDSDSDSDSEDGADGDNRYTHTQPMAPIMAIQYLICRLFELPNAASAETAPNGFKLATVYSKLALRLQRTTARPMSSGGVAMCRLLARILRALLVDDRASPAIVQWNVETTTVAAVWMVLRKDGSGGSGGSGGDGGIGRAVGSEIDDDHSANGIIQHRVPHGSLQASPAVFDAAAGLLEALFKRHMRRLEDRFHLVVVALQALLTRLLIEATAEASGLPDGPGGRSSRSSCHRLVWVPRAQRLARLLELVCEPATAAVAWGGGRRTGAAGGQDTAANPRRLHSDTDAAKREAGLNMHVVLLAYLKLQTDGAVLTRPLREALEPGIFSVLSVTPPSMLGVIHAATDAGGRLLFQDLYRRWLQTGKWKGV